MLGKQGPSSVCAGIQGRDGDVTTFLTDNELYAISGICLFLGVQSAVCNGFVGTYYRQKREGVFSLLYFTITSCNVILALDCVLHALLLLIYVSIDHDGVQFSAYTRISQYKTKYEKLGAKRQFIMNHLIFVVFTLTSVCRNSKLMYNTILVAMRTIRIYSPRHVFSRENSRVLILMFPILWMLTLAVSLDFDFELSAEDNMRMYVYFPEGVLVDGKAKIELMVILYIVPSGIIAASLLLCFYKLVCETKKVPRSGKKREVATAEHTYGQHEIHTDVALTVVFVVSYLPYTVLQIVDYIRSTHGSGPIECSLFFMTGVIFPFMNSALDPIVLVIYNSNMVTQVQAMMSSLRAAIRHMTRRKMTGVRFEIELNEYVNVRELKDDQKSIRKMSTPKNKWSVIEYKESECEESSDSSSESFTYRANRHKSRRYR